MIALATNLLFEVLLIKNDGGGGLLVLSEGKKTQTQESEAES